MSATCSPFSFSVSKICSPAATESDSPASVCMSAVPSYTQTVPAPDCSLTENTPPATVAWSSPSAMLTGTSASRISAKSSPSASCSEMPLSEHEVIVHSPFSFSASVLTSCHVRTASEALFVATISPSCMTVSSLSVYPTPLRSTCTTPVVLAQTKAASPPAPPPELPPNHPFR